MTSGQAMNRRTLFGAAATGAALSVTGAAGQAPAAPGGTPRPANDAAGGGSARCREGYRAEYHFTVPDQWKNDPQRPVWIDGEYHYYYLYNADYLTGGTTAGTAWRLATSRDLVSFTDRGVAIPKDTTPAGDVWSGSAVVDTDDTAGFGAGAVVALVTMEPDPDTYSQAQYLWYSTDGGRTFSPYGTGPVLANPGVRDYRDPKVVRDEERGRWVMLLAERTKVGFYHSADLREWSYAGGFVEEGLGVLECPDLFRITAEDGSETVWVLGVSANGKESGLPNTYAYWTGDFDGGAFHPHRDEPQWLDHGFDWYGAVTFEKRTGDGSVDPAARYAIAWTNNWDYPNTTPTIESDGFNGTDSVVREVVLRRSASGTRYLASRPVDALDDHVTRTVELGDVAVEGTHVLDYEGAAYEFTAEVTWDQVTGAGVQLRRSADGSRHVDAGVYGEYAFVNRGGVPNPDNSGRWQESRTPFDPSAGTVLLRVLVDRTTVEVFFDDGRHVHSMEAFPYTVDLGIALFATGGGAVFRDVVIRELGAG
ncbi:glycoside hydrolase family 32 protein [Nocardiopsis halotolerans]|uniref:glycoside hydrolase family 32 protein n=1 Tax=Nocardiopsis halotolerans TaxID=124252 RepID=UPI000348F39B|nr:GH32 C-terminal domain-containing protein [Nocardiopsis halotolerans]